MENTEKATSTEQSKEVVLLNVSKDATNVKVSVANSILESLLALFKGKDDKGRLKQ